MDNFMLRGVLCVSALCVLSSAARGRNDALELKDADFEYIAPEHETLLVKFYAPWCGHCKKLAPEFETAAARLKGTVTLAKVDCTANTETCKRYGVTGYPTLKIFRNGQESSSYDGPRSADGIVNYMKKQAGPDSVPLHSEHDLENFINSFDASIVGFFSGTDSSQLSEFLKGASLMRESFRFAHTTDLELGKKYEVKYESVLLFRPPRLSSKFEESVVHHRGPLSITGLRRFIRDNIFGLCPHLTKENKDSLRKRDLLTAYYDLDYLRNPKGSNYWRNRVLKVASKFSSQGLLYSVANRNDFLEELEDEFGLGASDATELPFVTIRTRTGNKYTMREEFTRDGTSLENFLEDYFAGRLKRYVKSEPVPAKNNAAVKVVVADTFEEIVNDPEKDVLIEFYAPWCGHCKKLEPKYTELGEQLYSDPNIVIAKMDATANDVPQGYDVQGYVFTSYHHSSNVLYSLALAIIDFSLFFCRFPTIYFAAAGRKDEPKRYEGAREVKDFINFLKLEASKPLVLNGVKEEL
uniref:Protein disulfide-isomerase n=1 Tax=Cyprinus carpio TaxID=7962 RepID=A0A8C2DZ52_CYPCA